jgi:hypothetical protein
MRGLGSSFLECGGKRSATPLWMDDQGEALKQAKAPSPLRSAGALQNSTFRRLRIKLLECLC